MKNFLLSVFLLFVCSFVHADTLDSYRVSFRGKVIGNFSERQIINVVMKTDSVFSNDTIKIQVSRDAPCGTCTDYSLIIFGKQGPMLIDSTQTGADFYIPLKPLVEHRRSSGTLQFHGYYTEYIPGGRARVVAFRITLE